MKKRRIIIICSIVAVLIILIGTVSALFNLREISVEILKNPEIIESTYGDNVFDGIEESGEFNYGSNTLFTSYESNKDKIEKAYPFVKVEKMVRRFPNKMTIYISGRLPEVIVSDSDNSSKWYVLDYEMKVLDVLESSSEIGTELYRTLPIVSGAGMTGLDQGDIAMGQNSASVLVGVLDGIYGEHQAPSSVMSDITIDFSTQMVSIVLRDRDYDTGAKITTYGFSNLKEKVFAAYHLYSNFFDEEDPSYPDKSGFDFRVGEDFVVGTNERVTVYYNDQIYNG